MGEGVDTGPGRRKHERHQSNWPAECSDAAGFTWQARVLDHSLGGLGLENCPQLQVNQVIRVRLESIGSFPCRVAWSKDGRCGVEFLPEANATLDHDVASLAEHLPEEALILIAVQPNGDEAGQARV